MKANQIQTKVIAKKLIIPVILCEIDTNEEICHLYICMCGDKGLFSIFYFELITVSAISTEFRAAPLNKLSDTIHKLIEFSFVLSSLILEI